MALVSSDLERQVLLLLGEPDDSPAGALDSGSGETDTIATKDQIRTWLNEAAVLLSKSCIPVLGTGTYTWLVGVHYAPLHLFTVTGGGTLWRPRGYKFGSSVLEYASRDALEIYNPGLMTNANGTPLYWFNDGDYIGIDPPPSAASTVATAEGFIVPPFLTASGSTWTWLPDSDGFLPVQYAASRLAAKNASDENLGPKAAFWQAEFDRNRMIRWLDLPESIRARYFPTPPQPIGGRK